jgi:hypothetical protein
MAGPMGKYTYVSDDTVSYRIKVDASNAAVASLALTANPGRVNLPHGYRPRHIWVKDDADTTGGRVPTGARRKVICGTQAATAWVGGATSVLLPDFSVTPSVAVLWTIEGRIGERRFAG